uniref:Uncharacterized protein n=1 Tax=Pristionchus pacificus TaxID=54126 RepID=A0A2A6CY56_PRIPA|eukprot:PDM83099.1 hypothetical protein PRIPAC_37492 [Pristionchus pacificus]
MPKKYAHSAIHKSKRESDRLYLADSNILQQLESPRQLVSVEGDCGLLLWKLRIAVHLRLLLTTKPAMFITPAAIASIDHVMMSVKRMISYQDGESVSIIRMLHTELT